MPFNITTFKKTLKSAFSKLEKDQSEALAVQIAANFAAGQTAAQEHKSINLSKSINSYQFDNKIRSSDNNEDDTLSDAEKAEIATLTALYLGYISEFNTRAQAQILAKVQELSEAGSSQDEIKQYVDSVLDGNENIIIDNVGKTRKEIYVDKELKLSEVKKTITKVYSSNVNNYAQLIGENAAHAGYEGGKKTYNIKQGRNQWVFSGPADERARPWHVALLGEVYTYGDSQSSYAEHCLGEPKCRHRKEPYYGDERDVPKEEWQKLKDDVGLHWDENKKQWALKENLKVPTTQKETPVKRTPEDVEKTIKEHEDKIKNRKTEKAYIFDKDGNVLIERKGTKKHVEFTDNDEKYFKGNIVLHNHPSGMSFSKQDILSACNVNTNEERVTGKYGTHILKLKDGSNFTKDLWDEKISTAYEKHYTNVVKELNTDIQRGKITKESADKVAMNKVWTRVAGDVKELDYKVIWDD